LKVRGLSYRTEASNFDRTILRNSIRHELLPLLAGYNPKITERLAATAEILAGDEEILDGVTEVAFSRLRNPEGSDLSLAVGGLSQQPRGLRLRLYRRALREVRGDLQRIGLAHLEAIDRLVLSERPNSHCKLPGESFAVRRYGLLHFSRHADQPEPGFATVIAGPGRHDLGNGGVLLVESVPRPASFDPGSRRVAHLDPLAAPFPWQVRGFAPGDRFTPLGMSGAQKVKDLFINEKVPVAERCRIPLLLSAGRILWVCGVRMAQEARVSPAAGAVLRVEILDISP
jgi:tRNA(Ile)-lysidine synthase